MIASSVRELLNRCIRATVGNAIALPDPLIVQYPMLAQASWRVGGLPLRVGGWFLGQSDVAGITLGSTVFLSRSYRASTQLLLHEMGHVRQFQRDKAFPMRYLWESARRGYSQNRFEREADEFAREVIWSGTQRRPS